MKNKTKLIFNKLTALVNVYIDFSLQGNIQLAAALIIFSIFTLPPTIRLTLNIIDGCVTKVGVANILSIASSVTGILTFLITGIVFLHKRRHFSSKAQNFKIYYLSEIQSLLTVFETVGIDLSDDDFVNYSLNKLIPTYIDVFEKYESVDPFGYQFYKDVSYFIAKYNSLNAVKSKFISLILFQIKYNFMGSFISELTKIGHKFAKVELNDMLKIYLYYSEQNKFNIARIQPQNLQYNDDQISNCYCDLIKSEDSNINKLFENLKSESLKTSILQHVLDKTYSIVGVSNGNNRIIHGPVLLIKNEENFQSWWDKLEEQSKIQLKRIGEKTKKEIDLFSLKNEVSKIDKKQIIQPFSFALKQDVYIKQVLSQNPWSPLYMMDCDELPTIYRNKPVDYIEKVIKSSAKQHLAQLLKIVNRLFPKIDGLRKELIFDYELVPFNPSVIQIRTRQDKAPKAFESLFLSSFIKSENRKGFVKAHILQIKKVLTHISPVSLLVKSCGKKVIQDLTNIEIKLLAALSRKKNGSIVFEGIENILSQEHKSKQIGKIFYDVCKKEGIYLKMKYIVSMISEIFENAKLISNEL